MLKVYTRDLLGQHFHSQFFNIIISLEYDGRCYVTCLKVSLLRCTDCMPSCLQIVENRQSRQCSSLGPLIDRKVWRHYDGVP